MSAEVMSSAAPGPARRDDNTPLVLSMDNVVQEFKVRVRGGYRSGTVSAVGGVSLDIYRGETFAVVGETGSGKSTLARTIIRAPGAKSGSIKLGGHELIGSSRSVPREVGRLAQMIFQDPFSALDPKWTIEKIVTEPLATGGMAKNTARRRRVAEILELVGLSASQFGHRYPYELSGGQAQRVAIARALVSSPELVICDEPVTSLDVSIQAQILKLLADLKRDLSLTYLLIAHDLAVVRVLAERTGTMYLGKLCEIGDTGEIFDHPAHPYTAALLSAIPPRPGQQTERVRIRLLGEPPSPLAPPSGCRFRTRCAYAQDICASEEPKMRPIADGQNVACHFPLTKSA
jgi:oligopeptide/dipeptide ABC transporter ATP-binding protein